jgi:hypothetical protein
VSNDHLCCSAGSRSGTPTKTEGEGGVKRKAGEGTSGAANTSATSPSPPAKKARTEGGG